jgi:hypothetical protein
LGLDVKVGVLAGSNEDENYALYKAEFEILNKVLRAEGVSEHVEPEELADIFTCDMSHHAFHCLRRVAAYLALGKPIPPPCSGNATEDPILSLDYWDQLRKDERLKYQHLIDHSDAEGFYVPVDFERPLDTSSVAADGVLFGSTQRLRAECMDLAHALDMPLAMHYDSEELWMAAEVQGQGPLRWQQYAIETFACLRLLAACDASLRTKAAIVFA